MRNVFGLFVVAMSTLLASQAQQEPGQQQVTLDRETIDAIAERASPVCRSELEAALEQQAEISNACKQEIHSILLTLSDKYASSAGESAAKPEAPVVRDGIHPAYWIVGFFLVTIGAIGAYVVYVNQLLEENGSDKAKKPLSKKKIEKLRMKGK